MWSARAVRAQLVMGNRVIGGRGEGWPGVGLFLKFSPLRWCILLYIHKHVFCTVNWLDVKEINIEVGGS